MFAVRLIGPVCSVVIAVAPRGGQTKTIRVDLKLRTGGAMGGLVVDHTDHGLVIVHEETPYVFAWEELEAGSAYGARRALLVFTRGGENKLSAADHYQLGLFALQQGRRDLAGREFRIATRSNHDYKPLIKDALDDYRRRAAHHTGDDPLLQGPETADTGAAPEPEEPEQLVADVAEGSSTPSSIDRELSGLIGPALAARPPADRRELVQSAYRTFGLKVQEVLGKGIVAIESDHFLIWTDWERRYRDRLAGWCESMYEALCERFNLDRSDDVFLAKCPMFCWRSKARFVRFARLFDGYAGTDAVGYTRSIEASGHVHVVLLRRGRAEADFNRFACTLVHEGTHAFLHRLYSSRLIPHWVNEGYADLMAERVLGDRCPGGGNARLLARQFARYDWPITTLLEGVGPIEVHQYPLAHSVVAYLEGLGKDRFAGFIKDLKSGRTVAAALAARYDDLTLDELESRWRSAVRAADRVLNPPAGDTAAMPWSTRG